MTAPLVVFPDPLLESLAILRDRLPAHASGVALGTKPFDVEDPDRPPLPYAAVQMDAALGRTIADEAATLRVSVWHTTDAKGLALAQVIRAVLIAYEGGAKVRSFGRLTGPVPTADPDTGSPLSYFTISARLRPTTL